MLSRAKTVEPIESSHKLYDTLTHQSQTINTHRSLHMGSPSCPKSQDFLHAQYLYSKIDRPSFTIGLYYFVRLIDNNKTSPHPYLRVVVVLGLCRD